MSTSLPIIEKTRINKKKYTFSLDDLYKHAHEYLVWKGYDILEKAYKEKQGPEGKELKIDWICTKDIDQYSEYEIKIEWRFYGINDVKAVKEGKEVKMQHGEMDTYIYVNLVLDYEDQWEESPFLSFLKSFYEKYLYIGTIGKLKASLWTEGWQFVNEIKAFVELYTFEV